MLRFGATRVEVGLQCLDDEVLRFTNRGHSLQDSRRALRLARDAGFKVCVHMMPGLPRPRAGRAASLAPGSNGSLPMARAFDPDPEADVEDLRRLFAESDWRPDMLKIYPTLVVMEGETGLKRMWERGQYVPLDTTRAAQVIARGKAAVPEWCRIQRIDRDIGTTHVEAGVMNSNLREIVKAEMGRQGLRPCRCIRCREAGRRAADGVEVDPDRVVLVRREYDASGGTETFLALEDPAADAVVAFLRLRKVGPEAHRRETKVAGGAAFVRELKVYGVAQALGQHDDPEAGTEQHRGHGARLLLEAERIAAEEWRVGRLLVIAGVGVKPYYRRHGYVDCGPYVAKDLRSLPG
jgi:elongator complex protein 3